MDCTVWRDERDENMQDEQSYFWYKKTRLPLRGLYYLLLWIFNRLNQNWSPLDVRTWHRFCCSCWCCNGRLSWARGSPDLLLVPLARSVCIWRPASIALLFVGCSLCFPPLPAFHSVRACQALLEGNSRGQLLLQTFVSPPQSFQNFQGRSWQAGLFCKDLHLPGTPHPLTRGLAARERPFASHLGSSCQNYLAKGLPTTLAL